MKKKKLKYDIKLPLDKIENPPEVYKEIPNINKQNKKIKITEKNGGKTNKININENTIYYKLDENKNKINLFGKDFVQINKDKCKIFYKGKIMNLASAYEYKWKKKEILEIKLKGINNINNANGMFYFCESLISLPDISNWNTSNVTNMNSIFAYCKSLSSLPDIFRWNTSKVKDIYAIFISCVHYYIYLTFINGIHPTLEI